MMTISALLWIGSHFSASGDGVEEPLGLIIGSVIYGLAANVFYTLGWISELLWAGGDTSRTQPFRKPVFYLGLIVSCALTLLPAALIPAIWWMSGFHHGPEASLQ
ncbi:MAG: hypothetical protein JOY90_33085 [Bradyrhizobium sp.]|uniref:hypothetical protein n=1 Tax=Bradyrhizobium sp. TaxID=376 RepID=UPI001D5F036C|nr:hypothetical protein [Bradyrhizobium sp.]MBV9565250.1 hypothetical protein [Bradyrhizobium sp.]